MATKAKFTADLAKKVITAIRAGNYVDVACASVGIAKQTMYNWLRDGARGDDGDELFEFVRDVHQALAYAECRDIAIIGLAARTNWQAAAWRRERMNPERWGQDRRGSVARRKKMRAETTLLNLEIEKLREELDSIKRGAGLLPGGPARPGVNMPPESDD